MSYQINTQKNLVGWVEQIYPIPGVPSINELLWHISSPVVADIPYGFSTDLPATWIDSNGNEQMAVIRGNNVYLDSNLTGGIGEISKTLSDVTILSNAAGQTVQLQYPKAGVQPTSSNTLLYVAGAALLGIILFWRKK